MANRYVYVLLELNLEQDTGGRNKAAGLQKIFNILLVTFILKQFVALMNYTFVVVTSKQ